MLINLAHSGDTPVVYCALASSWLHEPVLIYADTPAQLVRVLRGDGHMMAPVIRSVLRLWQESRCPRHRLTSDRAIGAKCHPHR